jgi:hypothetical protein
MMFRSRSSVCDLASRNSLLNVETVRSKTTSSGDTFTSASPATVTTLGSGLSSASARGVAASVNARAAKSKRRVFFICASRQNSLGAQAHIVTHVPRFRN